MKYICGNFYKYIRKERFLALKIKCIMLQTSFSRIEENTWEENGRTIARDTFFMIESFYFIKIEKFA